MVRPTGVTVIAVLCFIGAGIMVLAGLASFLGMGALGAMMEGAQSGSMAMLGALGAGLGIVMLIFAGLYFFVGWGLWTLKNWARIVAMVLAIIGALFGVLGLFGSMLAFEPASFFFQALFVAIYGYVAYYLNQAHVKVAFGTV